MTSTVLQLVITYPALYNLTKAVMLMIFELIVVLKNIFKNQKCNAIFARQVGKKAIPHTAVAPGNPLLDKDDGKRMVGTGSPKGCSEKPLSSRACLLLLLPTPH